MALKRTAVVVITALACAACAGKPAPADDRSRVISAVQSFGRDLIKLGWTTSIPDVRIGDCDGWAPVAWSARLPGAARKPVSQAQRYEVEQNVLGQADLTVRLGRQRVLRPVRGSEPALISVNADRTTELTVTVPQGDYVRVDGYVSCG